MGKGLKNRIRKRLGFTLAEMMLTLLIMVIATGIVVAGIPVAVRAYRQVVDTANAQVMLSTAMTLLRDELGMAYDVTVDGQSITYTSGRSGGRCQIANGAKGVEITESYGEGDSVQRATHELVFTSDQKLTVSYDSVAYYPAAGTETIDGVLGRSLPAGTFLLRGVKVTRSADTRELASVQDFVICTIREDGN